MRTNQVISHNSGVFRRFSPAGRSGFPDPDGPVRPPAERMEIIPTVLSAAADARKPRRNPVHASLRQWLFFIIDAETPVSRPFRAFSRQTKPPVPETGAFRLCGCTGLCIL